MPRWQPSRKAFLAAVSIHPVFLGADVAPDREPDDGRVAGA
jgi:hypothetical protein